MMNEAEQLSRTKNALLIVVENSPVVKSIDDMDFTEREALNTLAIVSDVSPEKLAMDLGVLQKEEEHYIKEGNPYSVIIRDCKGEFVWVSEPIETETNLKEVLAGAIIDMIRNKSDQDDV